MSGEAKACRGTGVPVNWIGPHRQTQMSGGVVVASLRPCGTRKLPAHPTISTTDGCVARLARGTAGTRQQLVRPGRSGESDSADIAARQREHNQHVIHQDGSRPGDRRDGKAATGIAGIVIWQRSGNRCLEGRGILCR
jgi:hypothetical protein